MSSIRRRTEIEGWLVATACLALGAIGAFHGFFGTAILCAACSFVAVVVIVLHRWAWRLPR